MKLSNYVVCDGCGTITHKEQMLKFQYKTFNFWFNLRHKNKLMLCIDCFNDLNKVVPLIHTNSNPKGKKKKDSEEEEKLIGFKKSKLAPLEDMEGTEVETENEEEEEEEEEKEESKIGFNTSKKMKDKKK